MKRYTAYSLIGVSLALVTLAALMLVTGTRPSAYNDPFDAFENIAPGQPLSVLNPTVCMSRYYFDDAFEGGFYCQVRLSHGDSPFESIIVTADNSAITVIAFNATDLQVGDLVYRWGRPDSVQRTQQHYTLRWRSGIYATAPEAGWYTLESPVDFVLVRKEQAWPITHV